MLKQTLVIVALTLALVATTAHADHLSDEYDDNTMLDAWISAYSDKYGSESDANSRYSADALYYHTRRVSLCETVGWTKFVGDGGLSVGPMQMHARGIYWSTPQGRAGYPREDYEANIAAGVWAISRGYGPEHWVHCWKNGR